MRFLAFGLVYANKTVYRTRYNNDRSVFSAFWLKMAFEQFDIVRSSRFLAPLPGKTCIWFSFERTGCKGSQCLLNEHKSCVEKGSSMEVL